MLRRARRLVFACGIDLAVVGAVACGTTGDAPGTEDGATTGAASTGSGTSDASTTTGLADSSGGANDESSSGGDDSSVDAECSIWDQDCPMGEKCAPWSLEPDLVPDEIRCCPEDANAAQPGDACIVDGYFGSCVDDCVKGSMCLDFDGDGMGTCQKYCTGSANDPACELGQGCFIYFSGVPFCFDTCDPLVQNCPEGNGCYPDADEDGGTGFLCLPSIGPSAVGGPCWLLSGCQPGLICVTPDFVPSCNQNFGCCTPLCDITETPDPCPAVDTALECVSWYIGGQMPPDVSYANVGACIIPP